MRSVFRFCVTLWLMWIFTPVASASGCVILLHGLARTEKAMNPLAERLSEAGYVVVNRGYPSRTDTIESLADLAFKTALPGCVDAEDIYIVTHSLGGILTRYYLSKNEMPNLRRVVMLGPPNQGSEVVDALGDFPGFKLLNGPAGLQLGTDEKSLPKTLGPVNFELGVIAGDKSINLVLSEILPKPNDGKVSVASTKVAGMKAHIVLPVTHTFMMKNETVIRHTLQFLKYGEFIEE